MKRTISEIRLHQIIIESINSLLNEIVEGNSPDEFIFDGERYVAMEDSSFPLLYHNGKWISKGETHRDIISLIKFGCDEWELEDYYGRERAKQLYPILDNLWSRNDEFSYPSRIFEAKGKTAKNGIKYLLISWDELDENMINDICSQFSINRNKLVYVPQTTIK